MTSVLNDEIEKDVLPWLKLAEDLRLLKLEVDLNIPQICVMGDQSSGKSSVLEALSGIPFPRGSGLVTRCPIRMVMRRAKPNETWSALVSTSINPQQVAVKDIPELSRVMDRFMDDLCSGSNNFSTESVIIDLTSPDACDLTVVDLPGIIRTVTAGQSVSSIEQVNRLIKSFLMDKRTIILAVIPSNQDIATIDILEKAHGVDPQGERTIGVLTKTDLIGPGNEDEVLAVVNNIRKPLALGYIMLKNRSQKDLVEKVSTTKAREMELAFFANHPVFRNCNPKLYGIGQLSKRLTHLLVNQIQSELAPMKIAVDRQISEVRSELRQLPSSYISASTTQERQKLLVSIIQQYVRHLTDCIRGEYRDRIMVRNAELRLYTIVLSKFEEFQTTINHTAPKFKDEEFINVLASQIEQLRGRELPGFMSSQAFYMCMSQYVDLWQQPMTALVQEVRTTALDVATKLADILLEQYPGLRDALRNTTEKILSVTIDELTGKLNDLIGQEKDPFTLNDFLQQWVNKIRFDRFAMAIDQCFDGVKTPAANWGGLKEEIFQNVKKWYRTTHSVSALASAQEMSAIMEAYWNLSAKRFVDNCCMLTDRDLLGKLPSSIQDMMYPFIRDDRKLEALFMENPELAKRKHDLEDRRDRLIQAASKLTSVAGAARIPLRIANGILDESKLDFQLKSVTTGFEKNSLNGRNNGFDNGQSFSSQSRSSVNNQYDDRSMRHSVSDVPSGKVLAVHSNVYNTSSSSTSSSQSGNKTFYQTVTTTVPIGDYGLGLLISLENLASTNIVVKEIKTLANGSPSPCLAAGIQIGDRIVAINKMNPKDPAEAIAIIKSSKQFVEFTLIRQK